MSSRAEALKNEGNARKQAGDLQGAARSYRAALAADPQFAAALYNLGVTLRELREFGESEAAFRRLLALAPGDVDALFNLASLLRQGRRLDEAAEATRRALALAPGDARLWLYLGQIGIERYTDASIREAVDALRRAIALAPELADAHHRLGAALDLDGRHEEALDAYARAAELEPGSTPHAAALLVQKQRLCDWRGLEALCDQVRRGAVAGAAPPVEPFDLLSIPSSPGEQLAAARQYARAIEEAAGRPLRPAPRTQGTRRRIGYLSAEFHEHATAYLAAELFELHDRQRFEVVAYSYGPDDGSPMRHRLQDAFDRFVDLRAASDAEAAQRIRADAIDILVDLKGFTFRARPGIAALRPAPIQVSYLGYPGTMGASFIDYLVADRVVVPPANEGAYSESLVLMPGCYQVNDRRRPLDAAPARAQLGLPDDAIVLCAFNQPYKIRPEIFALWMRILGAVPAAVLWLLEFNRASIAHLRAAAAAAGVEATRLIAAPIVPLKEHLARLGAADLFLDTLPYNAHTTASDALWAGVPVLTCPGETFASRVAASLLAAVGLPELAVGSLAEYESKAVHLGRDRPGLARLQRRLAAGRTTAPLFDTPAFVRNLELAYERMCERCEAGQPPERICLS